ncbi:MAG TPA: rhomboid family intramembrane serine protease [Verrucomicrobiae bacterium]|nr:rhomboid family intramembrane serine protease [Verrucomicrobiae bacterium]
MLDDRHYMRPEYRPRFSLGRVMPLSVLLIVAMIVAYALEQVDIAYQHGAHLTYLILSPEGLRHGYVWQLLTFQFLHIGGLHLFCNLLGIWFFGRFVEARLGRAHFLGLYFLSGIVGGLFQSFLGFILPYQFGGPVVGASAGVFGLIAAFTTMEPDSEILMFFVLPVRAKYLFYISAGIALFFTIVPSEPGIAHAAHLAGLLFGVAYVRWGVGSAWKWGEWNPFRGKLRRERMIKAAIIPPKLRRRPKLDEDQDLPSEEFISKEVDPILDKISAHGIQSLTDRERRILEAARAKMSKH